MRSGLARRWRHWLGRERLSRTIGKQMIWKIRSRGYLVTVTLAGELDVATVPGLDQRLGPPADLGRHLLLDLAGLRFCDCAGLSLFLRLQQRAGLAGGSLHLVATTAQVRRLIAATNLSDVLPVCGGLAEVIAQVDEVASSGPVLRRPDDLGRDEQPARLTVVPPARARPVPEGGRLPGSHAATP
jgi:anti-sigma B factor antagonist